MKKINTIKKNSDFTKIINTGKYFSTSGIVLYYEKNNVENYFFGISVGKKLGNAVLRNKIRRQIKNIIDKNKYENGYNCIIMIKKAFIDLDFETKSSFVYSLTDRNKLEKEMLALEKIEFKLRAEETLNTFCGGGLHCVCEYTPAIQGKGRPVRVSDVAEHSDNFSVRCAPREYVHR